MRSHALLVAALLLAGPADAFAAYLRTSFAELAGGADVIVVGTITDVAAETFEFNVHELVAGENVGPKLTVRRFKDWTCASRGAPYREGQTLLLFLRTFYTDCERSRSGGWRIMGAGAEGEMPIAGNHVYPAVALTSDSLETGAFIVHGGPRAARMPLDELLAAVRGFRACYTFNWLDEISEYSSLCICEKAALTAFASQSALHAYLVAEAQGVALRLRMRWRDHMREGLQSLRARDERNAIRSLEFAERIASAFGKDSPEYKRTQGALMQARGERPPRPQH